MRLSFRHTDALRSAWSATIRSACRRKARTNSRPRASSCTPLGGARASDVLGSVRSSGASPITTTASIFAAREIRPVKRSDSRSVRKSATAACAARPLSHARRAAHHRLGLPPTTQSPPAYRRLAPSAPRAATSDPSARDVRCPTGARAQAWTWCRPGFFQPTADAAPAPGPTIACVPCSEGGGTPAASNPFGSDRHYRPHLPVRPAAKNANTSSRCPYPVSGAARSPSSVARVRFAAADPLRTQRVLQRAARGYADIDGYTISWRTLP